MAHQYSAAPPYGAQYPTTTYYPLPFAQPSGQQMNNTSTGFQQANAHNPPLQTPSNLSNNARYDTNASIHHQPVPLHFAHFNPELLKHLPPPPPPPLIPPAHFGAVPGNAAGFPPFPPPVNSPHPVVQLGYPQFQPSPAPPNGGTVQEQRSHSQTSGTHEAGNPVDRIQRQIHHAQLGTDSPKPDSALIRSFDGAHGSHDVTMTASDPTQRASDFSFHEVRNQNSSTQHGSVMSHNMIPRPNGLNKASQIMTQSNTAKVPANVDLKERAKAALLSLVPYNIRYDNFLAEGVNSQILQQLYEELGLHWTTPEGKPAPSIAPSTTVVERQPESTIRQEPNLTTLTVATTISEGSATVKTSPAIIATTQTAVPSPNMERKDRIAQLLAAKAGKASASGVTSKSQSPGSATDTPQIQSSEPEASATMTVVPTLRGGRALAQTDVLKQKMEQLKKEAKAKINPTGPQDNAAIPANVSIPSLMEIDASQAGSLQTLPTPVREQLVQSGLSSLIPGLFMTSAEAEDDNNPNEFFKSQARDSQQTVSASTNTESAPSQEHGLFSKDPSPRISRKRSIAEDSTEEEYHQAKRQITHIEGSGDVPMEVDEVVEESVSEGEIAEDGSPLPDDREYHPDKPFATSLQTKATSQDYLTKQTEIDAMRKRIAEMEQRQHIKRGQSFVLSPTGSATTTPIQTVASQTVLSSPPSKPLDQTFPPANPNDRLGQSPRPLVKATPEQIAERAAQLKADFLRQRALRQKQLQEGIPALNDQVAKTQTKLKDTKAKLAQVQAEMREHEANVARAKKSEEQILQDIENLEKQISEGVSGQRQFSSELNDLKQQNKPDMIASTSSTTSLNGHQVSATSEAMSKFEQPRSQVDEDKEMAASHDSEASSAAADPYHTNQSLPSSVQSTNASFAAGADALTHSDERPGVVANDSEAVNVERDGYVNQNQGMLGNAMLGADHIEQQVEDPEEAMEGSDNESADSRMSIDEDSDDSVSMSDSGSDEYEPAEPNVPQKLDEKLESDEYEPDVDSGQQYDGVVDEEEEEGEGDDYEPAEDLSPSEGTDVALTPPSEGASSVPHSTNGPAVIDSSAEQKPIEATQVSQATEESRVDDQEKGLQLSEANTLTKAQNMPSSEEADGLQVLGATAPSSVRYAPYQSLLSSFKSYRFHPSFNEQVKDGYRSLTYSHKIDSKLPLCPTELDGTPCTDPECQEQHFSSMALTDDKILVQMSSANDIKDKGLREQYLIGLKQVIAILRQDGVKEFTAVADALSQYRRNWTVAQLES